MSPELFPYWCIIRCVTSPSTWKSWMTWRGRCSAWQSCPFRARRKPLERHYFRSDRYTTASRSDREAGSRRRCERMSLLLWVVCTPRTVLIYCILSFVSWLVGWGFLVFQWLESIEEHSTVSAQLFPRWDNKCLVKNQDQVQLQIIGYSSQSRLRTGLQCIIISCMVEPAVANTV